MIKTSKYWFCTLCGYRKTFIHEEQIPRSCPACGTSGDMLINEEWKPSAYTYPPTGEPEDPEGVV